MRLSAPPENMLNMSSRPPAFFSRSAIAAGFTPGSGMNVPRRYTTSAPTTNSRRCLSSVSLPSEASGLDWAATRLLHAAAGSLDRSLGAGGDRHALELHGALDFALLDDLHALGARLDQPGRLERVEIDDVALQRVELIEQHFGDFMRLLRAEADLRQATLQRHLATFETGLDLALAGARELALVATAGGLAETGTDAATDADTILAGTFGGLECVETHVDRLQKDC